VLMERSTTVRIQLAASPTLCAELRRALRPTFLKILPGDITSGEGIVVIIDDACPTIVLLEATLPELDLAASLDDLSDLSLRPRVIVIAPKYEPYLPIAQVYPACAGTLLRKQALSPLLPPVVAGIAGGCTYHQPPPKKTRLTDYEYTLLRLMVLGLDNQQIIDALDCSMNSVYSAQSRLRRKLGVDTNGQAIMVAIQLGLASFLEAPVDFESALP
jgi:DNA-binding CsgD family transcriptional regulator